VYRKNQIVTAFQAIQRPQFAHIASQSWDCTLAEYSHSLYQNFSRPTIEDELLTALEQECHRLGYSRDASKAISGSLNKLGVLQTTTHVALTEGPTFLAAHQLATLGFPANAYYIVAAFSGVPFSNSAWPACLNYSNRYSVDDLIDPACPGYHDFIRADKNRGKDTDDRRISLLPGKYRDARVFRSDLDDKIRQIQPFIRPDLARHLPTSEAEGSFTRWALQAAKNQFGEISGQKKAVYIDLNEVISHYLCNVLPKTSHPIHKLFFELSCQQEVLSLFEKPPPVFNLSIERKGKWKMDNVFLEGNILASRASSEEFNPESLVKDLRNGRYCPSLFLSFMILSFINGIQCLGGFNQIEYLHSYREKLRKCNWLDQHLVQGARIGGLTTGLSTTADGQRIFPLDIILGSRWEVDKDQTLGQWLQPLITKLLKN